MSSKLSRTIASFLMLFTSVTMLTITAPPITANAAAGNTTVYITRTGECYHNDGCSSLKKSKIDITLEEAIAYGYRACSKCKPPQTVDSNQVDNTSNQVAATTTAAKTSVKDSVTKATKTTESKTTKTGTTVANGIDYKDVYDYAYYCEKNPDVAKAYDNDPDAVLNHFLTTGMVEGRQACEGFNVTKYRSKNSDLDKAYGDNLTAYYYHYMMSGKKEKRKTK